MLSQEAQQWVFDLGRVVSTTLRTHAEQFQCGVWTFALENPQSNRCKKLREM
jgi:hypothetical protein